MQDSVKQDRFKYIGGSDIPVIMNLSPFKSRYDLLLEKAQYKIDDFEGNVYTEYGQTMEPVIRDYLNDLMKVDFQEGKHIRDAEPGELIGCRIHTDGEFVDAVRNEKIILEIKTTSTIHDNASDYKIYLVQLLFYMLQLDSNAGVLAVYNRPDDLNKLIVPERLQVFTIDRAAYNDLCNEIEHAVNSFIDDLARVKENPFITEAELVPVDITDIAARILAFESQIKYMQDVEKQIKEDKKRLKDAMQAAGVKSWQTPNGYKITLVPDGDDKTVITTVFDSEKLKEEHPRIYKQYAAEKTEIKKGRAGYVKITAPKENEPDVKAIAATLFETEAET